MDLSNYNFYASDCARKLDEIEAALGVKFDRKAMFEREQALWSELHTGYTRRQWVFKFSKDPSVTTATFDDREPGETGITETETHIEYAPHSMVYAKDVLLCSLKCLNDKIPDIQARRKPKPPEKQMIPQDKETHMHETIARASLVAFAEFIGQPIDADVTIQQARGLYGREGKRIAVVVKIPIDKTKPITANVVDSFGVHDGVKSDSDAVTLSYWPLVGEPKANTLRMTTVGMLQFAKDASKRLATERTKPTPPPPKPEPIPFEAECRAHVKTLNAQLGINLNEDAVLAAGEVARAGHKRNDPTESYTLSIVKSSLVASFSVTRQAIKPVDGVLVAREQYYPTDNGLQMALRGLAQSAPELAKQLTTPAPAKPVFTVDSIRPSVKALDRALAARHRPFFVFGDNTSTNIDTDCRLFLDLLGGTVERLYLTFQSHSQRQTMHDTAPRVHVHTEPMFFPSEFNTTISAPIDPANPAATLTALADRIRNENL